MEQEKNRIERVFDNLGLKPVTREKFGDYEIFYGDGFSKAPHFLWQTRMEIQPGEFKNGAFVTFWWVGKDEKLLIGRPCFFEPDQLSQNGRVNAAREDAMAVVSRLHRKH